MTKEVFRHDYSNRNETSALWREKVDVRPAWRTPLFWKENYEFVLAEILRC